MIDALSGPWPWYVAGPLIGLFLPGLILFVGRPLGVSSTFRDACAAALPGRLSYFDYDWRAARWRQLFVVGIAIGGVIAAFVLTDPAGAVAVSDATASDLAALGIEDQTGLVPSEFIGWGALGTAPGLLLMVGGGFLVGFGARWADGCTSGHAITGLASLRLTSLLAVLGFFAGGLISTHLLLPLILGGGQ